MKNNYSIGIVTYHARFDAYFVPLIKKLTSVFPDREILVVVNGHPDRTLQISYLKKITEFLSEFKNIRYITYDQHQSLSKCWNQLVILSRTERILIMNDDTQVTELFRDEFEKKIEGVDFSTLNVSWSHFLISKSILKKVGWFDERLLGVGHEDVDYAIRMCIAGLPATDTTCLGLNNYVVDQENPGWKSISGKTSENKYSKINFDFFREKWSVMEMNPGSSLTDYQHVMIWHGSKYPFSPKTTEPTPIFYDFKCLDEGGVVFKSEMRKRNALKITLQKLFYFSRNIIKKIYRSVVR